jgi:large subunit ribosomal protein L18
VVKPFDRRSQRRMRHLRVRKHVSGTAARPRLVVFRSHQHIYASLVDDVSGRTLFTVSTTQKAVGERVSDQRPVERAREVGRTAALQAKDRGITRVVFDRAGYLYHGRVAALAEGAREGGLEF